MRPLIGVTTSELRASSAGTLRRHGEPPHAEMALGMTYLSAIEAAGGMPVVLPPLGDVEALLDRLDGICLSGGPDLDPDAYGASERHAELGPTEPNIDTFELALARAADARGLPVLGICRGAQALNVARGGTLHQHVPGAPPDRAGDGDDPHRARRRRHAAGRARRRHAAARELLPSPGRRRARPRPARGRVRRRRDDRGDRGAGRALHARRPVACRGPGRPAAPPGAVRGARRGRSGRAGAAALRRAA